MRTLTFEPGRCRLTETPAPAPGAGQILLRVRGTLLDETHLADFRRGSVQAPYLVFGEVLQPGAGVIGLRPGQSVLTICRSPLSHYLLQSAEEVLPTDQNRPAACMLLGVALAQRAVEPGELYPESTVISGAGFVGLVLTALLPTTTPWVFGTSEAALLVARDLGAAHTQEWEQLDAIPDERPPEERGYGAVCLETTGRLEIYRRVQHLTLKGGLVTMAVPPGGEQTDFPFDATRLHYDQISWRALGPLTTADLTRAGTALHRVPDSVISDCLGLSEVERALQLLDGERGACYLLSDEGS